MTDRVVPGHKPGHHQPDRWCAGVPNYTAAARAISQTEMWRGLASGPTGNYLVRFGIRILKNEQRQLEEADVCDGTGCRRVMGPPTLCMISLACAFGGLDLFGRTGTTSAIADRAVATRYCCTYHLELLQGQARLKNRWPHAYLQSLLSNPRCLLLIIINLNVC